MIRLRSALYALYMGAATLLVAVAAAPLLLFGERAARRAVKVWARLMLFGLKAICGLRHRIDGAENIPQGGAIVAANHQSAWETIALLAILPDPVAVFKRELLRVPIYGWWGLRAGMIAVDRDGGARAIRALARAARAKLAEGAQIVVFPEGTRAPPGETLPLQPGVAAAYLGADVPCVAAVHDSGRYWRHPSLLRLPGIITLTFFPPIAPGLSRGEFMAALEARFAAGARAPGARPAAA